MDNEIWRDLPGQEGRYQVSDQGRVRSLVSQWGEKILSANPKRGGYLQVNLWANGKKWTPTVHTLVDRAFNGPIPDGLEVNHKDGVKANNRLGNLERLTRQGNMAHAVANGLRPDQSGDRSSRAVLSEQVVASIRAEAAKLPAGRLPYGYCANLARLHGVSLGAMSHVLHGRSWA